MIDALILDLDGVVRHWDQDHFAATAASFGMTASDFGAVVFDPQLLTAAMTGALTAEAWDHEIGQRVGARQGADPAAVAAAFAALTWSIDDEVVALVREVRASGRARVALFSNASTRLEADLESCGLGDAFDVIFNSARLGLAKPHTDAFRSVAAALAAAPERCLFVDDTIPNVEGARAAGMQAEPFTGARELRSLLERTGLL